MTAAVTTSSNEAVVSRKPSMRNRGCPGCPLVQDGPALPVHCVLQRINENGIRVTRLHVLSACGLSHLSPDSRVLSEERLAKTAEWLRAHLATTTGAQRVRFLALPFPFQEDPLPGDVYDEWRVYREMTTLPEGEDEGSTGSGWGDGSFSFLGARIAMANAASGHCPTKALPEVFLTTDEEGDEMEEEEWEESSGEEFFGVDEEKSSLACHSKDRLFRAMADDDFDSDAETDLEEDEIEFEVESEGEVEMVVREEEEGTDYEEDDIHEDVSDLAEQVDVV